MAKHLTYGGSTADRTLACPGWPHQAARMPTPKGSSYADEGTLKHEAMEVHYRDNLGAGSFSKMIGQLEFNGIDLNEEHIPDLELARDMVEAVFDRFDIDEYEVEPFVQLIPDVAGGSIDLLGVSADRKTALVLDYKFGAARVHAERTSQLRFYALCAHTDSVTRDMLADASRVVYAIVQPKCSDQADIYIEHVSELDAFEATFTRAMQEDHLAAGAHCKYCPGAPVCPEKIKRAESALVIDPKDAKQLSHALDLVAQLEPWIKQVREGALNAMTKGAQVPQYKLVESRTRRRWSEDAEQVLVDQLGEQAYTRTLINQTAAKKLMDKAEVEKLLITPPGKPEVAAADDKRPALAVEGATEILANSLAKLKAKT